MDTAVLVLIALVMGWFVLGYYMDWFGLGASEKPSTWTLSPSFGGRLTGGAHVRPQRVTPRSWQGCSTARKGGHGH
jgi:hypothetical protein